MIRNAYLSSYPSHDHVFGPDTSLASVTFPLARLSLKRLNPLWEGDVFWLYSAEDPYNTTPFQEGLSDREGRLSFSRESGQYRLEGDEAVFAVRPDWEQWVERTREAYEDRRFIPWAKKFPLKFGGAPKWLQGNETPRDPAGKKMLFVGQCDSMAFFQAPMAKMLYLFYAPDHDLVTQIAQGT